jgi:hypothetical protein
VFTFHMSCISVVSSLCFRVFSTSFSITFLYPEIAKCIDLLLLLLLCRWCICTFVSAKNVSFPPP